MIDVEEGKIYVQKLLMAGLKFIYRHWNVGRETAILLVTKWR
jgi:hypothetical protein